MSWWHSRKAQKMTDDSGSPRLYRTSWPTNLHKIKNLHAAVQPGAPTGILTPTAWGWT